MPTIHCRNDHPGELFFLMMPCECKQRIGVDFSLTHLLPLAWIQSSSGKTFGRNCTPMQFSPRLREEAAAVRSSSCCHFPLRRGSLKGGPFSFPSRSLGFLPSVSAAILICAARKKPRAGWQQVNELSAISSWRSCFTCWDGGGLGLGLRPV